MVHASIYGDQYVLRLLSVLISIGKDQLELLEEFFGPIYNQCTIPEIKKIKKKRT